MAKTIKISKNLWEAKEKLKKSIEKQEPKDIVRSTLEVVIHDSNIQKEFTKSIFIIKDLIDLPLWDKKLFREFLDRMISEEERKIKDITKEVSK